MEQIGMPVSARTYYLLGAKNEQYAVYHGTRFVPAYFVPYDPLKTMPISGSPIQLEKNSDPKYADYGICQMMYPVEYNIFGVGSSPVMSFKKDADGKWQKHFYVKDYLGSTRKVMKLDLENILVGADLCVCPQLLGEHIGSPLHSAILRKYDAGSGRFLSALQYLK